jgi:cytochrome P450
MTLKKRSEQSCIGMKFSMIEMKTFMYILLTNFVFSETNERIVKHNVCVAVCVSYIHCRLT